VLIFVTAFMNPTDFKASIINWYTLSIGVMLIGVFIFYPMMETQKRKTK